jgi:hypothetical protein
LASTVALTARSGFGELLVPYETDETLKEKLDPLRFRLDDRTGAVLADTDDAYAPGKRGSRAVLPGIKALASPKQFLPTSPLAKAHFEQEQEVQMRLLGPDGSAASISGHTDVMSPPASSTAHDRSSKVSFADGAKDVEGARHPSTSSGHGPGGLLNVPYAWEPLPLPELTKDGRTTTSEEDRSL